MKNAALQETQMSCTSIPTDRVALTVCILKALSTVRTRVHSCLGTTFPDCSFPFPPLPVLVFLLQTCVSSAASLRRCPVQRTGVPDFRLSIITAMWQMRTQRHGDSDCDTGKSRGPGVHMPGVGAEAQGMHSLTCLCLKYCSKRWWLWWELLRRGYSNLSVALLKCQKRGS